MKLVAFLSFSWDHEIVSAYYAGVEEYLSERQDTAVVLFNAYGEHEGLVAGAWALDLFSFCDLEYYDGFIVQGNRTWPPEERQRLVNRIRALGKPVVSINYDLEGAHYVGTDNYQAEYGLVELILKDKVIIVVVRPHRFHCQQHPVSLSAARRFESLFHAGSSPVSRQGITPIR